MNISLKRTMLAGATFGLLFASLSGTPSAASGEGRPSSYINPDTGAATANPDVASRSSCFRPDRYDQQAFSPAGTTSRNVHNDACFIGPGGEKLDGPASFESTGVGSISACPDPDADGPKVAVLTDTNGDGRNDLCFQSGYQDKLTAGDDEYHARLNNNTGTAGAQHVRWCSDPDRDGCSDEPNRSSIRIDWSADGTTTHSGEAWPRR